MNQGEVARRASKLPPIFADRLSPAALGGLRDMAGGGEWGELALELTATLAETGVTVSAAEQQELRALLEATGMPTQPIERLAVRR